MASTVKLFSLGILFLMSCVSGLALPYLILRVLARNCQNSHSFKKVLGVLNCFTGGVFLATSFLTLLPEGRETAEKAFKMMGTEIDYPITELLLGFGFLLILIIEGITVSCYSKYKRESSKAEESGVREFQMQENSDSETAGHTCNEVCASYQNGHVTVIPVRPDIAESTETTEAPAEQDNDTPQSTSCVKESITSQWMSGLHSIVLLIALSIHMVFDGLSLGLLKEDNEIWSVLLALGIHKILLFLSTGITIFESTTTKTFIIAMLYLSVVSPLGVGLGILLTSQSENVVLTAASGFLQALAVGTFVYVAIFEILLKEFSPGENGRILKAFVTIIGYSVFALIKYVMH